MDWAVLWLMDTRRCWLAFPVTRMVLSRHYRLSTLIPHSWADLTPESYKTMTPAASRRL